MVNKIQTICFLLFLTCLINIICHDEWQGVQEGE